MKVNEKTETKRNIDVKKLILQAVKFVGISGIGWLLDFCIYTGLGFISGNLAVNNCISSMVGVTFVFLFATKKVFENNSHIPLGWKYAIYVLYQCILIFSISRLLVVLNGWIVAHIMIGIVLKYSYILSKILVTPITMVLNFFVMKEIIERL